MRTSKRAMQMAWDFPVYTPPELPKKSAAEHTVVKEVEVALPREEAFAWLNKGDKRPLLVMRECFKCKGTDDALLSRTMKNEETQILTRFFHCVKLPVRVLEQAHPFHALFDDEHPPHLFFAAFDGSDPITMRGVYTQGDLYKAMYAILDREYVRDARLGMREMLKVFSQYDMLDWKEDDIKDRLEKEIEKSGPKSEKVSPFRAELGELDKKRTQLREKEKGILDLGLKARPPAKPLENSASKAAPKQDAR